MQDPTPGTETQTITDKILETKQTDFPYEWMNKKSTTKATVYDELLYMEQKSKEGWWRYESLLKLTLHHIELMTACMRDNSDNPRYELQQALLYKGTSILHCGVCTKTFDTFTPENVAISNCGHLYCPGCLSPSSYNILYAFQKSL